MYKHKNKHSPKALAARVARKTARAGVAAASTATRKEDAKRRSVLDKLTETIAGTGRAVLERLEEIPVVKKTEELIGLRQGGKAT